MFSFVFFRIHAVDRRTDGRPDISLVAMTVAVNGEVVH